MKNIYILSCIMFAGLIGSDAHADLTEGQTFQSSQGMTLEVERVEYCPPGARHRSKTLEEQEFEDLYLNKAMSCETRSTIQASLDVAAISIDIVAIFAACSGIGTLPVTVVMPAISVGVEIAKLALSQVACEDGASDERNRRLIQISVCEALTQQGVPCNPSRLP